MFHYCLRGSRGGEESSLTLPDFDVSGQNGESGDSRESHLGKTVRHLVLCQHRGKRDAADHRVERAKRVEKHFVGKNETRLSARIRKLL